MRFVARSHARTSADCEIPRFCVARIMRVEFIQADVVYRMTTRAKEEREKEERREGERNAFQGLLQEFQ